MSEITKVRVGLINVQNLDNFGAVLVAYSLENAVKSLGAEVYTIDYRPQIRLPKCFRLPFSLKKKYVRYRIEGNGKKYYSAISSDGHNRFEKFRNTYLNRTAPVWGFFKQEDCPCDLYVVGSDVVWKPERVLTYEANIYCGLFNKGHNSRLVSYAASIGTDDTKALKLAQNVYKKILHNFDAITVREESSAEYLQELTEKPVESICDPTFLLTVEMYEQIMAKPSITADEYILFLCLGYNEEAALFCNQLSKRMKCPVVYGEQEKQRMILDNKLCTFANDGPAEFLYRIKHAKYVVTDSFHATVFSLIFHKNFFVFGRETISLRMISLLRKFGLERKFLISNPNLDDVNLFDIDFNDVDRQITLMREDGLNFLNNQLGRKMNVDKNNR